MLQFLTRIRRVALVVAGFLVWQTAGAQTLLATPDLGLMVDGGVVNAVAVQADGKIVIGGIFSRVNGVLRNNIARLNADRTLDMAWNPNASGNVNVLAVSGNTVYAAGLFTTIGGQLRFLLAALDGTTGLATAWNPDPVADVRAIIPAGPIVYVGGLFNNIGGQPRNRIAALDVVTGNATTWNPNADSAVFALALSGTTIYAGGAFNNIGGQPRNRAAALATTVNTNNALPFDPNMDNSVLRIEVSGSTVYLAGAFSHVGPGPTPPLRPQLAAVDANSGALTAFAPAPDGLVNTISASGSTLYVGGNFANIGGAPRMNIAALNASGTALPWAPEANSPVQAILVSGSTVWAGGDFYLIGGAPAMQIALLDSATGQQVAGFHPGAGTPGPTRSVFMQPDSKVLVGGGQFNWVGKVGVGRNNLLRLNADGTLDMGFDPATGLVQPSIFDFAVSGSTVYIAGGFAEMGGQPRNNLAAVDIVTGNATSWNPNAGGLVRSISLAGTTLFAGGDFLTMGALARHYAAALDTSSSIATSWDPNADNAVQKVFASGSTVYVGGFFSNIGTQNRSRIAELNNTNGNASPWNPGADGSVRTFAPSGSLVYVGGSFANIGGQPRNAAAALDKTTGLANGWNPNVLGPFGKEVSTLLFSGSKLYAGGNFSGIGGATRGNLASLDPVTGNATPWNPNADSPVTGVAAGTGGVYTVGAFLSVLGQLRDGLAALSLDVALPPALQSTKSRKTHGGAGTFDLPLAP